MIVVDTSALIAILFEEPDFTTFVDVLSRHDERAIGAPNTLEAMMVAERDYGLVARDEVEGLLANFSIRVLPWEEQHLAIAHSAFRRFGKGSGHPAQLNFGDCMAYALARALDAPLLYKGDDFARTDIRVAL